MKLDVKFTALEAVVRMMGAQPIQWASQLDVLDPPEFIVQLGTTGIEIPLAEVEVTDSGLLSYRGEQILLYIKDTRQDKETLLYDENRARRFHVSQCKTLDEMRQKNRFERYVATNRKDGLFLVDALDPDDKTIEEIKAPLRVCKNCLKRLRYEDYENRRQREKKHIWKNFEITKFFEEYSSHFCSKPKYTDETVPKSDYSEDWDIVSKKIRERRDWTCELCKVQLSENKNLVQAHHRNGVKWDNTPTNLQVLCKLCHSRQPAHALMYVSSKDRSLIERLRKEQNCSPSKS